MSRTIRRKNQTHGYMWDEERYCSNWGDYSPESDEYKKRKSFYHSDSFDVTFKEPGPSWFRNLYTERPLRRENKQELKKFLLDPEYEPMCEERGKLEYWT